MMKSHEYWMGVALEWARKGWGTTHPNPMVGCVIVEEDSEVAGGFHPESGKGHAEANALEALGRKPRPGAVLYVTLEPCSTYGRTSPCTKRILDSGIRKVVVGSVDPNPAHEGSGCKLLREAGVEVIEGVREAECRDLNLIFNHAIRREGRPFVAMKIASTLDGKVATSTGESQWITDPEARQDVARWRRYFPAITVGANTVIRDNPRLTSRLPDREEWCPRRFILDTSLRSLAEAPGANVYTDAYADQTILVATEGINSSQKALAGAAGIELWEVEADAEGRVSLEAFIRKCQASGLTGIWVEPGEQLGRRFLGEGLADYLFVYIAPFILGDSAAKSPFHFQQAERLADGIRLRESLSAPFGRDYLVRGHLH